jgi:hypothetical protein
MGLFGKSTSKQTAKLKTLIKLTATRLATVRRPRLGRRSIARSDVGQLLSIGHLDRALLRVSARLSPFASRVSFSFLSTDTVRRVRPRRRAGGAGDR